MEIRCPQMSIPRKWRFLQALYLRVAQVCAEIDVYCMVSMEDLPWIYPWVYPWIYQCLERNNNEIYSGCSGIQHGYTQIWMQPTNTYFHIYILHDMISEIPDNFIILIYYIYMCMSKLEGVMKVDVEGGVASLPPWHFLS